MEEGVPTLDGGAGTYLGWGRGYLPWMGEGVPTLDGEGVPTLDGGRNTYPQVPSGRQRNRASTCYMAGGMPLAFTHEDFLVPN